MRPRQTTPQHVPAATHAENGDDSWLFVASVNGVPEIRVNLGGAAFWMKSSDHVSGLQGRGLNGPNDKMASNYFPNQMERMDLNIYGPIKVFLSRATNRLMFVLLSDWSRRGSRGTPVRQSPIRGGQSWELSSVLVTFSLFFFLAFWPAFNPPSP